MFLDTHIALISDESFEGANTLASLGVTNGTKIDPEEFERKPMRVRIDDIKYIYQSLHEPLLVIELYDTEGTFMIFDSHERVKALMDKHYSQ